MKISTSLKHRFGQQVNIDGIQISFNNNGLAEIPDIDFSKIESSLIDLGLEVVEDQNAPNSDKSKKDKKVVKKEEVSAEKDPNALIAENKEQEAPNLEEMELSALHQILTEMGEFDELPFKTWDKPTTIKFIQENL